jgi:hypothetical protein
VPELRYCGARRVGSTLVNGSANRQIQVDSQRHDGAVLHPVHQASNSLYAISSHHSQGQRPHCGRRQWRRLCGRQRLRYGPTATCRRAKPAGGDRRRRCRTAATTPFGGQLRRFLRRPLSRARPLRPPADSFAWPPRAGVDERLERFFAVRFPVNRSVGDLWD